MWHVLALRRGQRAAVSDERIPSDWVVVAECASGSEASLIQGRLSEGGIANTVLAARSAPGAWLTGAQADWAPKVIAVARVDEERAHSLLAELAPLTGDESDADIEEPDLDAEPDIDEYGYETSGPTTFMGFMRAAAGVIALLLALGLAWTQCSA